MAAEGTRVRTSVADLTPDEAELLATDLTAERSGLTALAEIPGLPSPIADKQGTPLFLPWNRALLVAFEQRALEASSLGVPVWDWTTVREVPEPFTGPLAAGPLDLKRMEVAALPLDGVERTVRDPGRGSRLPTRGDVARVLSIDDFADFSTALEALSGAVHVWVGGHMALIGYAPYDPLFWAHRAMVDAIWWAWQDAHPSDGPPESLAGHELWPFSVTVADVWSQERLGYAYELVLDAPPPPRLPGAGNDRPAAKDALGFRHYVSAFAEIVASRETVPPLTIGIFGSWGMGKSTLLDGIVGEIQEQQRSNPGASRAKAEPADEQAPYVHVVRFNAWDCTAGEPVWPALVHAVMRTMAERIYGRNLPRRFLRLLLRNARREWDRNGARIAVAAVLLTALAVLAVIDLDASVGGFAAALGVLGLGGLAKVTSDTVNNPTSRWIASLFEDGGYGQPTGTMEATTADLDFLERRLPDGERILLVIDDLDRSEPGQAIEALQAINRLLDSGRFVVIMGIDARIVTAAIEAHYSGVLEHAGASGYEYLDKIVQIPFRIPEPDATAIETFLLTQLPLAREPEHADRLPATPADVVSPGSDGNGASAGYTGSTSLLEAPGAVLGERVAFTPEELEAFQRLRRHLRPNPRHVKRLINVYRLVRTLAESKLRDPRSRDDARLLLDNPDATIRWLVLSAQWPFTAGTLMAECRRLAARPPATNGDRPAPAPPAPTLRSLLDDASGPRLRKGQQSYDDDVERLDAFIEECDVSWDALRVICDHTINFNPAVELAVHRLTTTADEAPQPAG